MQNVTNTVRTIEWLTPREGGQVEAVVYLSSGEERTGGDFSLSKFLGRSPLQRMLYQLYGSGVRCCLVVSIGDSATIRERIRSQGREIAVADMAICHLDAQFVHVPAADLSPNPVVVQGNFVCDERITAKVCDTAGPARMLSAAGEVLGIARLERGVIPSLRSDRDLAAQLGKLDRVPGLSVDKIPRYIPAMRRTLKPSWQFIRQEEDQRKAARKTMDRAQKGVLDFPARYLHPVPENFLASLASGTAITPNQITVFSGVVGFVGTYCFAVQAFLAGLLIAVAAGILDGVDGKLARVKLLASPYGDRLDHAIDMSFEFSWYLAIGWGLYQATGDRTLFIYGFVIIGVMLINRVLSGLYKIQTGRQIHDHTAFDRAVRLIAGRRNIYVLVLLAGSLADDLLFSYFVVIIWGVATAVVYSLRNVIALSLKQRSV